MYTLHVCCEELNDTQFMADFLENFEPAINLIDPDNVFMSSKEVFNNLQRLFPSNDLVV